MACDVYRKNQAVGFLVFQARSVFDFLTSVLCNLWPQKSDLASRSLCFLGEIDEGMVWELRKWSLIKSLAWHLGRCRRSRGQCLPLVAILSLKLTFLLLVVTSEVSTGQWDQRHGLISPTTALGGRRVLLHPCYRWGHVEGGGMVLLPSLV